MNPEKPRPQGFDGVCIGIPVGPSYGAPPPPPTSASNGHNAALRPPTGGAGINSTSASSTDIKSLFSAKNIRSFCFVVIFFFGACYLISKMYKYPSFKVEWASVSVDQSNYNSSSAVWNIGPSVDEGSGYDSFDYRGMDVLFRSMSEDWTRTVVTSSNPDPSNMTSLVASVNTSLPRHTTTVEFEVMIGIKFARDRLEANCKNMTVGFLSSRARGIMSGPRLCDVEYHDYN